MESLKNNKITIIKDLTLSANDNKALVKLWKLLVPDYEKTILPISQKTNCSHYSNIDIPLIHNEGLPAFQKVIGEKRLNAILRHCGYGVIFPRQLNSKTLDNDLACLRTLECAQYYLSGFKTLINNMANQLYDAPEDMDVLTKAKYIRNFFIFFSPGEFFVEELVIANGTLAIDYSLWNELNKCYFFPEETYTLCDCINKNVHIRYSAIEFALNQLEHKLYKKVMELSELTQTNYPIATKENYKFKDYRTLKSLIHANHFHFSYTTFAIKEIFTERKFQNMMLSMVIMLLYPLAEFKEITKPIKTFEKNILTTTNVTYYEFSDEKLGSFCISSEKERECCFELFKHMADNNIILKGLAYSSDTNQYIEDYEFEWQVYYALTLFGIQNNYVGTNLTLQENLDNIDVLISFYKGNSQKRLEIRNAITRYWFSERSASDAEQLENVLGIKKYLEEERIEKEKALESTIIQFASEHDIEIKNTDETLEMIRGFWLPYFSEAIAKYQESDDTNKFEQAIGFDPFFADAYFNLEDIDVNKIQEKLLDLKRSRATEKQMQRNALLIALYCYLIEGNIPCGSKKRPPTRNKSLRPENLKSFITA